MTSLTTSLRQSRTSTILAVVGFAAILAASAQVSLPIPGTPVPFTLQPIFSPVPGLPQGIARFMGPTGGYLIAYPIAAWVTGTMAGKQSTFLRRFLAACAGIVMIFVGGIAQLTVINHSLVRAVQLGVTLFVPLDAVKALIAAAIATPRKR